MKAFQTVHILSVDLSCQISDKFKDSIGISWHKTKRGPLETGEGGKEKSDKRAILFERSVAERVKLLFGFS